MPIKIEKNHPDYDKYLGQWRMARDFGEGEQAVKDRTTAYLPLLSGHENIRDKKYRRFLASAYLWEATTKTAEAFVAMLFRKDPLQDFPAAMDGFVRDVTGTGQDLDSFMDCLASEVINPGRAGVLVEYPETLGDEETLRLATAERLGRRPFWALYSAEAIPNWRDARQRGSAEKHLYQIVLEETYEADDGSNKLQRRELRLGDPNDQEELFPDTRIYFQQIWREINGEWMRWGDPIIPQVSGSALDKIPFFFVNHRDNTPEARRPLLMPIVNINRGHYNNTALFENALTWTSCPIPVVINNEGRQSVDPETEELSQQEVVYEIGGDAVWELFGEGANAKMLEYAGQGLGALENAMRTKKEEMSTLGARMLMPEKRAAETAETSRLHRHGEYSNLARLANVLNHFVEKAMEPTMDWMNVQRSTEPGDLYRISKDFWPLEMTPEEMRALLELYLEGGMTFDELRWNLVEGERLPSDSDHEAARRMIAKEQEERDTGARLEDAPIDARDDTEAA